MLNLGINNELFPSSTTTTAILHDAYPPSHHCYPHFTTTTIPSPMATTRICCPCPQLPQQAWPMSHHNRTRRVGAFAGATSPRVTWQPNNEWHWCCCSYYYWWWVPPPSSHSILLMVTTQQTTCHHCAHKWQTSSHKQPTHTNKPHHLQSTTQCPLIMSRHPWTTAQHPQTMPHTHERQPLPTSQKTT